MTGGESDVGQAKKILSVETNLMIFRDEIFGISLTCAAVGRAEECER